MIKRFWRSWKGFWWQVFAPYPKPDPNKPWYYPLCGMRCSRCGKTLQEHIDAP
jgi:hypothetical protein